MRHSIRLLAGAAALAASTTAVVAQVLPPSIDPGSIARENQRIQRQIEQQTAPIVPSGPPVVSQRAPNLILPPGGPTFILKAVTFDSSKFISPAELDAIAARYIGRSVDIAALQSLVNEVNEIYIRRGLVTASATIPAQNLKDRVFHVALTEGRAGKISIEGVKELSPVYVQQRVSVPDGEVVDPNALTRQVNFFNRSNDAQIQALLQPGAQFGLTDISLAVTEPKRDTLQIFADNFAVKSVGTYEMGTIYKRYGLFGVDDRLTLYGVGASGQGAVNAAYSVPVTTFGTRVGLSYSGSLIHVIRGPFTALDVRGSSQVGAGNISQLLYGDRTWLAQLIGSYSFTNSRSTQAGVQITDNDTPKESIGLALAYSADPFQLSVSPTFSYVRSRLKVAGNKVNFNTFNGIYSGSVRLPAELLFTVNGSFQIASKKLLPGDQLFQIGGPTTIRGYPSNAVAGGSGYYFQAELHKSLNGLLPFQGFDAFGFVDHGTVYSTAPSRQDLTSAGAGLSYTNGYVTAEMSVGVPIQRSIGNPGKYAVYGRLILGLF